MRVMEEYGTAVFVLSIIVGLMTFPIGLAIPLYFHIKAKNGNAEEHTTLEIVAILFAGVIAIPLVELFGRTGAILSMLLPIAFIGLFVLVILAGAV